MESLRAYRELVAKVDEFLALVKKRYGSLIRCRKGCSHCCAPGFGIFPVEAWAIREGFESLAPGAREKLLSRIASQPGQECEALWEGGCLLYPLRPILCRTHGYPLLVQGENAEAVVKYCQFNFFSEKASEVVISGDCVLDLEKLNRALAAVNLAFLKESKRLGQGEPPQRVSILHFVVKS